jgi:hypothetical protein
MVCSSCGAPLAASMPVAPEPSSLGTSEAEPEFAASEADAEPLGASESEAEPEPEPEPAPLPIPLVAPSPPITQGTPAATGGGSQLLRSLLMIGAVAVAAALVAWVVLAKPWGHRPPKTLVATRASSEEKARVVSPSPTFARSESGHQVAPVAPRRQVVVVSTPPPTPRPAPAKAVPTAPPPTPEKKAAPVAPVIVDNFVAVRTLPRRICVQYKVENVTLVEITNEGTGATIYSRNLDVANGRVAENPQPICLRRGTGSTVLEYELQASGPGGEVVRTMFVQPGSRGKRRYASP